MSAMSMAPNVAGVSTNMGDLSTAACLAQGERPSTPPEVHKWRKSNYAEPGQRIVHPGMIEDFKGVDPTMVKFGRMVVESDHVEDVWRQPGAESEFALAKHGQQESLYYSVKREPLGKSYSRGHELPAQTASDKFSFGKGSASSEAAKSLLYPKVTTDESEHAPQYVKSHGSYAPGEQRVRAYNWRIDPSSHRFGVGVGSQVALNGLSLGVSSALRGDGDAETSRVTSKKVEDFKNMKDQLGRARNLGHGDRGLQGQHTFGKASMRALTEWDARMCVQGDYHADEQQPDLDLSQSHTPGFRNTTNEVRPFGVPTVRSDIPKYARKSIADNQNYGDDVNAQFLLYPGEFTSIGVEDEDLVKARSPDELRDIFHTIGHEMTDDDFVAHYEAAASMDPRGGVSVHSFRLALNEQLKATDKAAMRSG